MSVYAQSANRKHFSIDPQSPDILS